MRRQAEAPGRDRRNVQKIPKSGKSCNRAVQARPKRPGLCKAWPGGGLAYERPGPKEVWPPGGGRPPRPPIDRFFSDERPAMSGPGLLERGFKAMDFEESPRKSLQNSVGTGYSKRWSTKSARLLAEHMEKMPLLCSTGGSNSGVSTGPARSRIRGYLHFLAHF